MSTILPDYGNLVFGPWDESDPKDTGVISSELASSSVAANSMDTRASAILYQLAMATPNEMPSKQKSVQNDIDNLTRTKLREKYKGEYNSWSGMKSRCKKGYKLHPDFEKFTSFLSHMGPKPAPDYTLDRRDTLNPEYSPDNCQWAGKQQQTANRKNTTYLTSQSGVTKTLAEWSVVTGTLQSTMHSRRANGWADHEVIYGRSSNTFSKSPANGKSKKHHPDWTGIVSDPEEAERQYKRWGHGEYRQEFAVRMCLYQMTEVKAYVNSHFDVQRDEVPAKYGKHYEDGRIKLDRLLQRLLTRYDLALVSNIVYDAGRINGRCS